MSKVMPRLTTVGFARSVPERADAALMDFYVAKYSQTNHYRGQLKPLAWLVAQYGNDQNRISTEMANVLREYLGGIFESATVEIDPETTESRLNLKLRIIVRDEGVEYDIGHVIRINNSEVMGIFAMVNDGIIYDPLKGNP